MARTFIAERLALVGDAAHVIHPIAGQGLNLGLKDVAALAEVIVDAARLGLDPGALAVLERYQRWRRFDTMAMGVATDGLNRLFSNHSDVLRLVRDVGLGLVDRLPALKRFSSARPRASSAKCRSCCAARRCSARRSPRASPRLTCRVVQSLKSLKTTDDRDVLLEGGPLLDGGEPAFEIVERRALRHQLRKR